MGQSEQPLSLWSKYPGRPALEYETYSNSWNSLREKAIHCTYKRTTSTCSPKMCCCQNNLCFFYNRSALTKPV